MAASGTGRGRGRRPYYRAGQNAEKNEKNARRVKRRQNQWEPNGWEDDQVNRSPALDESHV